MSLRAVWAAWPGGHIDLSAPQGTFTAGSAQPWSVALPMLKADGYTHLLPCVASAGCAWYPSSVVPQHPIIPGRCDGTDQMAAITAAAAAVGIKVYPWIVCWRLSPGFLAPANIMDSYRAQGRLALLADGTEQKMLCPSDQRNRNQQLALIVEVATKYKVTGIHLDYMRFDDVAVGSFTPAARARFEQWTGAPVVNWPSDCATGVRHEAWRLFNRHVITSFMREVRAALKKVRSTIKLAAATFPTAQSGRDRAQDWPQWVQEGIVDWVAPMTYVESLDAWLAQVKECAALMKPACRLYPAINLRLGAPNWWDSTHIHVVDPAINAAKFSALKALSLTGFAVWQWGRGLPLPR